MFSMSRNILAMSEFTSGGCHVGFQDGRHMFNITLYLTSYCTLEGNNDSLYLGKWLLCENCHHMAAISKSKMAAISLYMPFSKRDRRRLHCQLSLRKFLYLHFILVQMVAIFNFMMTAALPVLFSVVDHTNIPVHVS